MKSMELLDNKFSISLLKVNKSFLSEDGTRKWLFKLKDGKDIETVFIPEGKRGTICVSSQGWMLFVLLLLSYRIL